MRQTTACGTRAATVARSGFSISGLLESRKSPRLSCSIWPVSRRRYSTAGWMPSLRASPVRSIPPLPLNIWIALCNDDFLSALAMIKNGLTFNIWHCFYHF